MGNRTATVMGGTNDVRQRVISAKMLRVKNLQNQLNDARQHIAVSVQNKSLNFKSILICEFTVIFNRN